MDNISAATDAISKLSEFRMPRHHELPDIDCYMDQVISIMEKHLDILSSGGSKFITPAMINNYVKLGLIPPPIKKRYTREHLCYLYIICSLKSVIAIPAISELIGVLTRSRPILEVYDLFCDAYENMLRRIYKRIRLLFPNAKIIFALSTAVIEEREFPEFLRYNREIEAYNQKAREVMEELGVEVNDLYSLTSAFDHSLYADAVHFNDEGSKVLADAVIKACLPEFK